MNERHIAGIKLFALDLDGTVLSRDSQVREDVAGAIERLRRSGVECVVATGRRLSSARPHLERLDLRGAVVLHNGAVVASSPSGPTIWSRYLDPDVCRGVLAVVKGKGLGSIVFYDAPDGPDEMMIEAASPDPCGYLRWYTKLVKGCYTIMEDLGRASLRRVTRVIAAGEIGVLRDTAALLGEMLPSEVRTLIVSDPIVSILRIEILNPEATKSAGVRVVADLLGIGLESVAAIGDDVNDLDMVREAACGIAVRNAHEELRDVADHVTSLEGPEGFLEAVEWILG
ncbi:MAG: HAD family hydrolase [Planctomycetota bacterium]